MDKLDTKFLAHIGVELALISGLAFYFYKQNSDLKGRVTELEQKVHQMAMILQQGMMPPPHQQQGIPQGRPQGRNQPRNTKQQNVQQEPDDDYDEDELDDIINKECENGVCPLPTK